jgi:hypothetical protein
MKKLFIPVLLICCGLEIKADIAPIRIQAKGISIKEPTEIKMTYERVIVYLTPDSSFVHCYFKLHNEGKAHKIQIGYPNMSTGAYTFKNSAFAPIDVYRNGKKIDDINSFTPDSKSPDINNRSWYLWDTHFDENETMEIEVSYSLPHGIVKNDLYYKFDYLLSTGAGWKGNIDTAEIIINLKSFNRDLILKTSPDNYTTQGNQIIWKFFDFEPSVKDNISIWYEMEKGQYEQRLKKLNQVHSSVFILDDKTVLSNDIRDGNNLENINPDGIAKIEVIKDPDTVKKKFPGIDSPNGLVLVYTKKFAIDKLSGILHSKLSVKQDAVKFNSVSDFEENYSFIINDKYIKGGNAIYDEIIKLDKDRIIDILIKNLKNHKHEINIRTDE